MIHPQAGVDQFAVCKAFDTHDPGNCTRLSVYHSTLLLRDLSGPCGHWRATASLPHENNGDRHTQHRQDRTTNPSEPARAPPHQQIAINFGHSSFHQKTIRPGRRKDRTMRAMRMARNESLPPPFEGLRRLHSLRSDKECRTWVQQPHRNVFDAAIAGIDHGAHQLIVGIEHRIVPRACGKCG